MNKFTVINSNEVSSVIVSHMRCDGTFNVYITMNDGSDIELYGISSRVIEQVEYNLTHPDMSIKFDNKFLTQTMELWHSQNGIKCDNTEMLSKFESFLKG